MSAGQAEVIHVTVRSGGEDAPAGLGQAVQDLAVAAGAAVSACLGELAGVLRAAVAAAAGGAVTARNETGD
jgi:hypothetical protein